VLQLLQNTKQQSVRTVWGFGGGNRHDARDDLGRLCSLLFVFGTTEGLVLILDIPWQLAVVSTEQARIEELRLTGTHAAFFSTQ
jgi:hypothetical protein